MAHNSQLDARRFSSVDDLFGKRPRRPPRVMMHVADAGDCEGNVIRFECRKCGHDTGWIRDERTISENKRGMPCPECNGS